MNNFRVWWQAPKLHQETEGHERKVSWLELFYDLVFVVIIARLAHYLGYHLEASGVLEYLFLFLPVFWVWVGGTIYNDRFETHDVSYRFFVFLQILAASSMAVFIEGGLDKSADAFAWSYVAARLIIIAMWWRGGRHNPIARPLTNRFVAGFSIGAGLWVLSIFVEGPLSLALKLLGLAVDLITPATTLRIQKNLPRLSTAKITERFGLFAIIVLGEGLLGVINGFTDAKTINAAAALRFGLGMLLIFGLWWIYFDYIARRPPAAVLARRMTWSYAHFFLLAGITALAAVLVHMVGLKGGSLEDTARWILLGSYAAVLAAMALLIWTLEAEKTVVIEDTLSIPVMLGAAVLALGLGFLKPSVSLLLGALVLINLGFMLFGAVRWFSSPASRGSHADEL
ncbi:MAG: low temperature requirement protein A [Meiothermus sp.]|nr:low temperature requirement protein A [Meiothermus sp.]